MTDWKAKRKTRRNRRVVIGTVVAAVAVGSVLGITNQERKPFREETAGKTVTEEQSTISNPALQVENLTTASQNKTVPKSKVGETVYFGHYEQDQDGLNGKEEIEWIVLNRRDNKMLLISKYVLDCHAYYGQQADVTWEKSSIRHWLNTDFLDQAFSAEEQKLLLSTSVLADANDKYETSAGNETVDKVFLLSEGEAERYLSSRSDRVCQATPYAKANGVQSAGADGPSCWWLRTPGFDQSFATYVQTNGGICQEGLNVRIDAYGVRPVVCVDLAF